MDFMMNQNDPPQNRNSEYNDLSAKGMPPVNSILELDYMKQQSLQPLQSKDIPDAQQSAVRTNSDLTKEEILSSKSQNSQSFTMDYSAIKLTSQQEKLAKFQNDKKNSKPQKNNGLPPKSNGQPTIKSNPLPPVLPPAVNTHNYSNETSFMNASALDDTMAKMQKDFPTGIALDQSYTQQNRFQVKIEETIPEEKPKTKGKKLPPINLGSIKQNQQTILNKEQIEEPCIAIEQQINVEIDNNFSRMQNSDLITNQSSKSTPRDIKTQKNCLQRLFRRCEWKSTITVICIIYALFFLIQLILEISNSQSRSCNALKIGCQFQPAITNSGEIHRLILSSLLQASWLQIISSVFTLLFYGYVLERNFGWQKMVILYVTCGISGNLFTGVIEPYDLQVGPSSVVMGIFVLEAVFLYQIWHKIPRKKKRPFIGIFILLLAANLLCVLENSTVRFSNCLGGIVSGILLAFYYYKPPINRTEKLQKFQKGSIVVLAILIIALFIIGLSMSLNDIKGNVEKSCSNS